jgi:hypothetical protein
MGHRHEVLKLRSNVAALKKALDDKTFCKWVSLYQQTVRNVSIDAERQDSEISRLIPQPYVVKTQVQ